MILIPVLALVSLTLFLAYRTCYILYLRRLWKETCALYVLTKGEGPVEYTHYAEMWPLYLMVLYVHVWTAGFPSFIVDQETMFKVMGHFDEGVVIES